MRWPKGPPLLALNPPVFFVFCSPFLSLLLVEKKASCSPKTLIFQCLPLLLLSLFWPPPFSLLLFFFFLSLSLSLVLFFLPSFLSFLFAFFWFLVLVSFFCFLLGFCFMKRTASNIILQCFFINPFSVLVVSCFVFSLKSLFSFVFSDFKLCFCSTSMFCLREKKLEKQMFGQEGGSHETFVF